MTEKKFVHLLLKDSPEELRDKFYSLTKASSVATLLGVSYNRLVYHIYRVEESKRYKIFEIPKKSGGYRQISTPITAVKIILLNSLENQELDIFLIDYCHLEKKLLTITKLKKQLETDNIRMIKAKIKDDFIDFCRYAWLQIEPIMNLFLKDIYKDDNDSFVKAYEIVKANKKSENIKSHLLEKVENKKRIAEVWMTLKIDLCFVIVSQNKENIYQKDKSEEKTKYYLLFSLYELRNVASHRDIGLPIKERIDKIKFNIVRNQAISLYEKRKYQEIKKTLQWFIVRISKWIPS